MHEPGVTACTIWAMALLVAIMADIRLIPVVLSSPIYIRQLAQHSAKALLLGWTSVRRQEARIARGDGPDVCANLTTPAIPFGL
ncbi:hypothetical protein CQZ76_02030 [Anaplasma marginale]|nr:hypothetical protein CQZ76_02030 [Anaplasma marginale]